MLEEPSFSQLTDHIDEYVFNSIVKKHRGNFCIRHFTCWEQYLCMLFAQLTNRDSLREIETCLRAVAKKLYHSGIRSRISRSTLAEANETRPWQIYHDFALHLIREARILYSNDKLFTEISTAVYAFDSTTIDLCLTLFPWAHAAIYQKTNAAVKLHTLFEVQQKMPTFIRVSAAKAHDVNFMDALIYEPGAFYIFDRGYVDFSRLYRLDQEGYPDPLRRIKFYDVAHDQSYVYLTNNFHLGSLTIANLYRARWDIEMFFKWIKQHLRIKSFFGTSPNAVKTQIWIAVSTYVLVAIIRKRLNVDSSLYTILQILSISLFEKTQLNQLLTETQPHFFMSQSANRLNLFDF